MEEWVGIACLRTELFQLQEQLQLLDYELRNPPWYIAWYISKRDSKRKVVEDLSRDINGIKYAIEMIKKIKNQRAQ